MWTAKDKNIFSLPSQISCETGNSRATFKAYSADNRGARAMHFFHDFLPGLLSHLSTLAAIFVTGDNIYLVCFLSLTHFLTWDGCDLKGNYKSLFQVEKQPRHSGVDCQGTPPEDRSGMFLLPMLARIVYAVKEWWMDLVKEETHVPSSCKACLGVIWITGVMSVRPLQVRTVHTCLSAGEEINLSAQSVLLGWNRMICHCSRE